MNRALALALVAACQTAHDRPPPASQPAAPTPAPAPAPAPKPEPFPVAGITPVEGDITLADFAFASGEKLPELRIHYTTLGTLEKDAAGHATNAVLIMHGTTGSGHQFYAKQFATVLFGPGQPLDARRFYIILPDDIGHGHSSKPSDGLRTRFPHYGYHDMVAAEHDLVGKLGVDHLRLVMGTSMGCMHSWMWAEQWPDAIDAVMPLACNTVEIAGRNRQWREMVIDGIKTDPAWKGGDYTEQPAHGLRLAADVMLIAGMNPIERQATLPTAARADADLADRQTRFIASHDANDVLYAVASSSDYDPSRDLEKITAPVMFVNSADDFINPPELGLAERAIKRVKHGTFVLIPASENTHGHGTHTWPVFWQDKLVALLKQSAKTR
ncbi:MAG TPA: alpha/beta fold hydrolase [Kofleriaceae bacterium]|nr:alpha/beta fold hydrolase [Kofleriaceae bacterium]